MNDFLKSAGKPLGVAAGVLLVAGVAWFLFRDQLKAAANKVNPASDKNVIYQNVVGGIGRAVSGDDNWSLGGWIYDTFGGGNVESARIAAERKPPSDRTWLEKYLLGG